ncbi:MAG: hypothetical protein AAFZ06_16645, partial [Pseudomonadota bacterium]
MLRGFKTSSKAHIGQSNPRRRSAAALCALLGATALSPIGAPAWAQDTVVIDGPVTETNGGATLNDGDTIIVTEDGDVTVSG